MQLHVVFTIMMFFTSPMWTNCFNLKLQAAHLRKKSQNNQGRTRLMQYPKSTQFRATQLSDKLLLVFRNVALATAILYGNSNEARAVTSVEADQVDSPLRGFQTKSGLKYFDIIPGINNTSPEYGQLISFHYTGYFRPAGNGKLDTFDSSHIVKTPFLQKHGNGRIIEGIEEAIHTMNVGGKRRVIIPKNLGYIDLGLGPLPVDYFRRKKLGELIDRVNRDEGDLVFDLELLMAAADENDQGYYADTPVSQDDLRELIRLNTGIKREPNPI